MACLQTGGIGKSCEYSFGGLFRIATANISEITGLTYAIDGTVTGVTFAAGKKAFEMGFVKNSGSFTQELQVTAGGKYWSQVVTFNVNGLDQLRLNLLEEIGLANLVVFAMDKRGKTFVLGLNGGLEASAATANSGAAESDALGMTLTLSGASIEIGPEMDTTLFNTILL